MNDEAALRQIFERLGGIEARLKTGAERHDEFAREIVAIKQKMEPLPLMMKTVEKMEPIVDDYQKSRNKMAGIFLVLSMIAGGVGFFASEIKASVVRLLR